MKKLFIIAIYLISINLIAQEKPKKIIEYNDVERMGNFITRWYFDIVGTSLIWKQKLILYSDSTYHYTFIAGECATIDEDSKGNWSIKNDTLLLEGNANSFNHKYVLANDKLYLPETYVENSPKNWIMK